MSRRALDVAQLVVVWAVSIFVGNLWASHGDVVQAALIAAVVTPLGVTWELRLRRRKAERLGTASSRPTRRRTGARPSSRP